MNKDNREECVKSGDNARCKCGYEGLVYGVMTSSGGTAPWCPKCQRNDRLSKIKGDK